MIENTRPRPGRPTGSLKGQKKKKTWRPRKYIKPVATPNRNEKAVLINRCMETYVYWEIDSEGQVIRRDMKDILAGYGLSKELFHYYLNRNTALQTKRLQLKEAKLSVLKDTAQDNLWMALKREGIFADLESKEVAKLSLDMLKNTDKMFQPKIQRDINVKKVDLSIPMEDLLRKIEEYKQL